MWQTTLASVGAGVLAIGLFHAGPGAFGRREQRDGAGAGGPRT